MLLYDKTVTTKLMPALIVTHNVTLFWGKCESTVKQHQNEDPLIKFPLLPTFVGVFIDGVFVPEDSLVLLRRRRLSLFRQYGVFL